MNRQSVKTAATTLAGLVWVTAMTFAGPLEGVWINTDPDTRSVPKVEITEGTTPELVWWGKTHPEDSRYGPLKLILLGESPADRDPMEYGYAEQDSGFAMRKFILRREGDELLLEMLTIFKDDSGRANFRQLMTFQQQP